MKHIFITTFLVLSVSAQAQFFQFSQRQFTPQRVNPAIVGSTNYLHGLLDFRTQTTAGGFSLLSTTLDLAYPVSWGGSRKGGIGGYFLDDRAATRGIYSIQEAGFSASINVPTAQYSSLNLGLGLGYQRRSFDLDGLTTGAQFVPDRGFDPSLSSGEDFGDLNSNFTRWNAGIYWRQEDKYEELKSYIGFSAFDVNQPDESVLGRESTIETTLVAEAGFKVHETREGKLYAEAFAFGAGENYSMQGGVMYRQELFRDQYIEMRARYSTEHFVMLGATIERENLLIGASYDLGLGGSSSANASAFEVGIGWRMYVEPKGKKRKKKSKGKPRKGDVPTRTRAAGQPNLKLDSLTKETEPVEVAPDTTTTKPTVTPEPEKKQETEVQIGQPVSDNKVIDSYEVRLPFRFNSSELSEAFTNFLDDVIARLNANPDQMVQIIGHTDNVGPEEVNMRISLARAQSAADYLMAKGISKERIRIEGKGETLPISSNDSAQGRALNRRVEIKILEKR